MNPITIPILVTIAVVGIMAIVLVKLFYKDKNASDLSDELPPIVTNHWQESFSEIHEENDTSYDDNDDLNEYGFVSKSWVEPMEKKQESDKGVASKVFQEPMHSKHQDIISNEYQKDDIYTPIESSINNAYNNNNNSNNAEFDDLRDEKLNNTFEDDNAVDYDKEYEDYNNDFTNENTTNNITNNTDYPNQISNELTSEYITPKKYYSSNNNDYGNYEDYDYENNNDDKNRTNENNSEYGYELDNNYSDSYNNTDNNDSPDSSRNDNLSENKKETLDDFGAINMGEQVTIGGKPYIINVGDEIIFNYNGETYSSKIFEIKHENIKVKYRAQEKWIGFSDIKKIF